MNKNQIIILLSILFISLAIGLYFVGFKEGLANVGTVNDYLKGINGEPIMVNGTNVTITRLTAISNVVAQTEPDIKLDRDGFPILSNGKVTYNREKYELDGNGQMQKSIDGVPIYNPKYGNKGIDVKVGDLLRDDQKNLVSVNGKTFEIKKLNNEGIVVKTEPDIELDKFGYAVLTSSSKVKYNPQVYQLDENGQIKIGSNGKPRYNPTYKFTNDPSQKYNSNSEQEIKYHASEEEILKETGSGDLRNNDIYVLKPEIIKAREAHLKAYQNALAELADSQSSTEPDLKKKEDNIKIKKDTVTAARNKLDLDNQIIEQSNKDFLAYQSAISSGDNNEINKAIETLRKNLNYIKIAKSNVQGDINFYDPAFFRFGPSTYVPNYEDSVYLSRTTGQSTIGEILNPAYMLGGMCDYYKNQPTQLEAACQKLDKNTCASTSCCVLLGGSKCVSGTEQGPKVKSNFSDIYVRNRDYYYYQGKCYGNCPP